jgi:tetratricopeptide (TPR) repeat protein
VETTTEQAPAADGVALANQGYALQQAGNYAAALPLLRRAVLALTGSGLPEEAYADYNLAFTRFAADPNRCDGVLGLLARSERIQGQRDEIDQLRRQWEERCGSSDEQAAPGHGRGKGRGKGKGHDG